LDQGLPDFIRQPFFACPSRQLKVKSLVFFTTSNLLLCRLLWRRALALQIFQE